MTTDEALAQARAAILLALGQTPDGAVGARLQYFLHVSGLHGRTDDGITIERVFDRALKRLKKERLIAYDRRVGLWVKKVEGP
jgi:hypothetical protein